MITKRKIYQIQVEECPISFGNCLGCPFYCGASETIRDEYGVRVMCGWTPERQRYMEKSYRQLQ